MPEVLEVQVIPSVEVRMVPELPTETNNGLEVVVAVESVDSSFSPQEKITKLKRNMRIIMSKCLIGFLIG